MATAKAKVRRFAEGTDVDADKSRAELEKLLKQHGAEQFLLHVDVDRTTVIFKLAGRMVRQVVKAPDPKPFETIPPQNKYSPPRKRTPAEVESMVAQEWRRRWRALLLIVKGKLEMISSGESDVGREFLADILLPNGETVGEAMLPRIAASYESGDMPPLMLGSGR